MASSEAETATDLKRKRLDAWRKRLQEQQHLKPSTVTEGVDSTNVKTAGLGFSIKTNQKRNGKRNLSLLKLKEPTSLWELDDDNDEGKEAQTKKKAMGDFDGIQGNTFNRSTVRPKDLQQTQKRSRWDATPAIGLEERNTLSNVDSNNSQILERESQNLSDGDALDQFMDRLSAGAMGSVIIQDSTLSIDVGGSMMRFDASKTSSIGSKVPQQSLHSGGIITLDDLKNLKGEPSGSKANEKQNGVYGPSDWDSEAVCIT
jgi:hypothetical protein